MLSRCARQGQGKAGPADKPYRAHSRVAICRRGPGGGPHVEAVALWHVEVELKEGLPEVLFRQAAGGAHEDDARA